MRPISRINFRDSQKFRESELREGRCSLRQVGGVI